MRRRCAGRSRRARDVRRQAIGEALVRRHAEAVGQRRQQDVLRAAEDGVDELRHVVAGRKLVPGSVAQERVAIQLVGGAEHQSVPGAPTGIGPFRDPAEIAVAEAEPARFGSQLRPERLGAAQPGGAQSHEKLVDGRHHRALAEVGGKRSETVQRGRMPGERPKQVRRPVRIDAERLDSAPDLGGPGAGIGRIDRLDPGRRRRLLSLGDDGCRGSATAHRPRGRAGSRGCRPADGARRCAIRRDEEGHRRGSRGQQAPRRPRATSIRHRVPLSVRSSGGRASRQHSRAGPRSPRLIRSCAPIGRPARPRSTAKVAWTVAVSTSNAMTGSAPSQRSANCCARRRRSPLSRCTPYRTSATVIAATPSASSPGLASTTSRSSSPRSAAITTLEVDQDSHGSPGTRGRLSMATPSATARANSSSSDGPGRDRTISTKSRTVKARRCTGPTSATGVPPRSTT